MITGDVLDGFGVDVDGDAADPAIVKLDDLGELNPVVDSVGIPARTFELRHRCVPFGDHYRCAHLLVGKCGEEFLDVLSDRVSTLPKIAQGAPVGGVGVIEGAQRFEIFCVIGLNDSVNRGSRLFSTHSVERTY